MSCSLRALSNGWQVAIDILRRSTGRALTQTTVIHRSEQARRCGSRFLDTVDSQHYGPRGMQGTALYECGVSFALAQRTAKGWHSRDFKRALVQSAGAMVATPEYDTATAEIRSERSTLKPSRGTLWL